MTLFTLIPVIYGPELVRIYDVTEEETKCIFSGLAGLVAITNDLSNYFVESIKIDGPSLAILVKKG